MSLANSFKRITVEGIVIFFFLTLIAVQLVAKAGLSLGLWQKDLRLGWAFLLVIVGLTAAGVMLMVLKYSRTGWEKKHVFVLLLLVGLVMLTFYYLPRVVPSVFEQSILEAKPFMQSILPGG